VVLATGEIPIRYAVPKLSAEKFGEASAEDDATLLTNLWSIRPCGNALLAEAGWRLSGRFLRALRWNPRPVCPSQLSVDDRAASLTNL
jgi:hypothetical protein